MNLRIESWLRENLGPIRQIAWMYQLVKGVRLKWIRVESRSPYENIYYCCTQKTASQWLRFVLSDSIFFKYSGLNVLPYRQLGLKFASFKESFPTQTIVTHLYIGYPVYLTIPKPKQYKTFFILRDPRDIVTSWYFSARYSHVPIPPVPELRKELKRMDQQRGFMHIIDTLDTWGSFDAQRSWMNVEKENDTVKVFRYEDLAHDSAGFLKSLFAYLKIHIPEDKFAKLCERHLFKKYSGWRNQGIEDHHSHYRKGVAGDWKNYFNREITNYFWRKTGDLLCVLGYEE